MKTDPVFEISLLFRKYHSCGGFIKKTPFVTVEGILARMDMTRMGRGFSIEMKSKNHVKSISISDKAHDRVLFEGDLGELKELSMIDGEVLEVKGANGTLRIDLNEDELRKMLTHPCEQSLSSEVGSYTSTNRNGEERK